MSIYFSLTVLQKKKKKKNRIWNALLYKCRYQLWNQFTMLSPWYWFVRREKSLFFFFYLNRNIIFCNNKLNSFYIERWIKSAKTSEVTKQQIDMERQDAGASSKAYVFNRLFFSARGRIQLDYAQTRKRTNKNEGFLERRPFFFAVFSSLFCYIGQFIVLLCLFFWQHAKSSGDDVEIKITNRYCGSIFFRWYFFNSWKKLIGFSKWLGIKEFVT